MIQIWSGIKSGRVLNEELYAQRLQKLINLSAFANGLLFHEGFSSIVRGKSY